MSLREEALNLHKGGKLEIKSKIKLDSNTLKLAYTPGVAEPCMEISKDKSKVYEYTIKSNSVAIVTDGSSVLGLGNIGPEAALPVMEGKSILFKEFGNVDVFPICLATQNPDEIVEIIKKISPVFGGINLEDIAAPRCFEIEERLKKELDIPVMHDDQHGTAIVVKAALMNALKVVGKRIENINVVINGAGAAGIAIAKMLVCFGTREGICISVKDIILCDTHGAIYKGRKEGMNPYKEFMSRLTNRNRKKGDLKEIIKGADVFIGVSIGNVLTKEMVSSMNKDAVVFAMANPIPEIMPQDAKSAGARIVGTGRSDFPNQINNVLAFPGVFRGVLDAKATSISEGMKLAATYAIVSCVSEKELNEENIIPSVFNKEVAKRVAEAVAKTAIEEGLVR